jgi:hypothetical protein
MKPQRPETFEPEVLALLGAIFDETWAALAPKFRHAHAIELAAARGRLASIMLGLAEDQLASSDLKQRALAIFTGDHQRAAPSAPPAELPA